MADENPDITSMPAVPALSATSDTPVVVEAPVEVPVVPVEPVVEVPVVPVATDATDDDVSGDAGEDADAGEPSAPVVPPRRSAANRFSELAAARRQAEEQRAAADARADRLAALVEKMVEERAAAPAPAAPAPVDRPIRETFSDPDSYDAALIEWAAGQAAPFAAREAAAALEKRMADAREVEAKTRQDAETQRQQEAVRATWQEKRAKALEKYPDFEEVAESDALTISTSMIAPLLLADNGTDVLYHLGTHTEEATRIAGLNPVQQAIEIGKLSATLATPPRAQPSRLPKPITPVGGRNGAATKNPNEMSIEEYAAMRNPQLMAQRRAGLYGMKS